jgi:hypothetical protein
MPQSTDLVKEVVEVRRLKAGERNVTVLVWVHTLRPSAKSTTNGIDQDSLPGSDEAAKRRARQLFYFRLARAWHKVHIPSGWH